MVCVYQAGGARQAACSVLGARCSAAGDVCQYKHWLSGRSATEAVSAAAPVEEDCVGMPDWS